MASKIFLDANILLDFLLKREDYNDAKKLIQLIIEKKIRGFVTPAIVHIVAYWVTKAYGITKTKQLLLILLADVTVIDCTHEITLTALNSRIDDIEDALQYYTAIHHKIDFFISRDKILQKSAIASLPVYNLKEFLNIL
ncbi:PIN domain-containing protein [Dyadobacter sp. CY356]|uniref:type II toxin-antitoxin system VapC family toxin n=1 Tax=Dyadobacter sp. CY356 TaxID=2906442 RepID=UPI001F2BB145|nr:PIN domain-containing protein [Dyadobacter sp. CY356]MCF0059429.1 PIN domain-containing protein [Dyadobacter sp. CY356]